MRQFYGYIRVSTVRQGQHGVSLQEQKDAILRYAQRSDLEIIEWFTEQVTAAKQGRPVFNKMLKLLRAGRSQGVVLHKIDRGARNLKDWASIADLNDQGIDVHLANDGLDMKSRGGRLSADIQAVVASDYIRNLREETLKGFYGRLKQGILPMRAPLGYKDNGGGKVKTPDPVISPLIIKAFELYATRRYSLDSLVVEMHNLGLRNLKGRKVTRNGLSIILNNMFYTGLIEIKKTGELFTGAHEPLISKSLYNAVKEILHNKTNTMVQKHDFLFRRMFKCQRCNYTLIGELQRGHHYYRCHTKGCPSATVREDRLEHSIKEQLKPLTLTKAELAYFDAEIKAMKVRWATEKQTERKALQLRLGQIHDRQNRLLDAFLDGSVDKAAYDQRRNALVIEQKEAEDCLARLGDKNQSLPDRLSEFLEHNKNPWLSYEFGIPEQKRDILNAVSSNRQVFGENLYMTMRFPHSEIAKYHSYASGDPKREPRRMLDALITALQKGESASSPDSVNTKLSYTPCLPPPQAP